MYLEVTFRKGEPLAAYLYLQREPGDRSTRTVKHESGLLIDFAVDGRPIGIEITAPRKLSIHALNQALACAHQPPAREEDVAPLLSAQ
jgi:uncharacterized protein YuzE